MYIYGVSVTLLIPLDLELNLIRCYKDNEDFTTIQPLEGQLGIIRSRYSIIPTTGRRYKKKLSYFYGKKFEMYMIENYNKCL